MKKLLLSAVLLGVSVAWAQTGSTVYLDPSSPFSTDFSAALQKKDVPVTVTVNPTKADYTATFSVAKRRGSVFEGITTELTTGFYKSGAWDQATIQIVDNHSQNVVFSYTCKKGNNQGDSMTKSVAECLAKHWKQHMQK
ncbi:MAG: hypothetical protein WA634_12665 [Silvibacterium sp.]